MNHGLQYSVQQLQRIRIFFTRESESVLEITIEGMRDAIDRVSEITGEKLGIAMINVFLATDRKEFDRLVSHLTRTPTDSGRIGQPQGNDLYLLSPVCWPEDALPELLTDSGNFDAGMFRRLLIHETVHIFEEWISPVSAMENRPAWFSEGLAVYISEQFSKDRDMVAAARKYLDQGKEIPELAGMNGMHAYLWGWTFIEYVLKVFGWQKLIQVLKMHETENIQDAFGPGVEMKWRRQVHQSFWFLDPMGKSLQSRTDSGGM